LSIIHLTSSCTIFYHNRFVNISNVSLSKLIVEVLILAVEISKRWAFMSSRCLILSLWHWSSNICQASCLQNHSHFPHSFYFLLAICSLIISSHNASNYLCGFLMCPPMSYKLNYPKQRKKSLISKNGLGTPPIHPLHFRDGGKEHPCLSLCPVKLGDTFQWNTNVWQQEILYQSGVKDSIQLIL